MKLFRFNNIINFLVKTRVPAGWIFFILVVALGRIQNLWGILIILIGEIFRTTAAGTITKNEKLTTTGIYKFVRHPLYLGSFCIALGLSFICKNLFIWLYFLICFPLTYAAAIIYEEKWLETNFGDYFLHYKKTVPAFIPFRIRKTAEKGNFSWTIVFKNKEHHNWLILVIVILLLLLKTYYQF
ncbi:MAG TPA: isoprenylcysteine carboxylmethyltransferase family protein [bacterium]|nr:isoprenylcysteine carboxylmethyltransferase family protein [bacterium]